MEQTYASIVMILLIMFIFVPLAHLQTNTENIQTMKWSLNLAVKELRNNVTTSKLNYKEIAKGYELYRENYIPKIEIDRDRLMVNFNEIMRKNYGTQKNYDEEIKPHLVTKVLADYEKFFMAARSDEWFGPYHYTYTDPDTSEVYYLNTANLYARRADATIDQVRNNEPSIFVKIEDLFQDEEDVEAINEAIANATPEERLELKDEKERLLLDKRNKFITQKINQFIADEKYAKGMGIEFRSNKESEVEKFEEGNLNFEQENFNPLEGITFFVIYREYSYLNINYNDYNYKHFNVVGYTLRRNNKQVIYKR